MPTISHSSDAMPPRELPHTLTTLPHQLFHGTTWHSRLLPSLHKFAYPYRYWGVNISALAAGQALPEVTTPTLSKYRRFKGLPLFSGQKKALQQFCAADYLIGLQDSDKVNGNDEDKVADISDNMENITNAEQALERRLRRAFIMHTGSAPLGDMMGLVVCRNAGVYFSPVNFYLGFDGEQTPTHLLAEVSNTPWNKRHYYGFLLDGADTEFCHDKDFHVSPFNPIDQQYRWQVTVKKQPIETAQNADKKDKGQGQENCLQVRIAINISDARGEVLKTGVKMMGIPMTSQNIRDSLRRNPLMNISSLTRIYWHAFKLYAIKKVPYINYNETLSDSQQQETDQRF